MTILTLLLLTLLFMSLCAFGVLAVWGRLLTESFSKWSATPVHDSIFYIKLLAIVCYGGYRLIRRLWQGTPKETTPKA